MPEMLNPNKRKKAINATADLASKLTAGILCYFSRGTSNTDVTQCAATYGRDSLGGKLFIVEIQEHNTDFPTTTTRPEFPNRIPNASATLTDYTHPAEGDMQVIELEIGDIVWVLGSTNGSFDTTEGYDYYITTDGFVAAPGDPDGAAIDESGHCFTSLATTLNQNWALMKYKGQVSHDKSA